MFFLMILNEIMSEMLVNSVVCKCMCHLVFFKLYVFFLFLLLFLCKMCLTKKDKNKYIYNLSCLVIYFVMD